MSEAKAAPSVDEREGYIGGSDAAAILGLSPYASPFSVFVQKRGERIDPPEGLKEKFEFGHLMEPVIAKAFQRRYPMLKVGDGPPPFMRRDGYEFLGGHLDFSLTRTDDPSQQPSSFLECKNIEFQGAEWSNSSDPEGRNERNIPIYYLAQCDHYMALCGFNECYLAALFGGCRLVVYPLKRSLEREALLLEAEKRFWRRVVEDDPPDFMGSIDDLTLALKTEYLASVTGKTARKAKAIIQLNEEAIPILSDLRKIRSELRRLKKQERLQTAAFTLLVEGRTGYLQVADEKWGSLLMQSRKSFDDFGLKLKYPEIYEEFEEQKLIGPILRLTGNDDEEQQEEGGDSSSD